MADISTIPTDQLLNMLQSQHGGGVATKSVDLSMEGSLKNEAASRPAWEQALAGVGTRVNDAAMRLKQIFGNDLTPQETADIRAGRQLRQVSIPALAGGIGGDIAMTYPIAPQTLLGNIASGGAISGMMNPVLEGESTLSNISKGAVGQGLGYGIVKGLGILAQPIRQSEPVKKLVEQNIIPTIGQAARSTKSFLGRTIGNAEDALTSVPGVGGIISGARARAQEDLQRAAIGRATPAGIDVAKGIGHEAIQATDNAVSDAYGLALDKIGTVSLDKRFLDSGSKIVQKAVGLNPQQRADVSDLVEQVISSRVNPAGGTVSADVAKLIDSDLGSYARQFSASSVASERLKAGIVREIQSGWRDLIRRNAPDEATARLLDNADRAFANLLRVEKAAQKSATSGGEFTGAQLNQAVRELTPNKRVFSKGQALMQDISGPAAQVLTGKLGESGTVPRGLLAMGLLGGGGAYANEQLNGPDWLTNLALGTAAATPLYSRIGSQYAVGALAPAFQQNARILAEKLAPYAGMLSRSYINNKYDSTGRY